MRKERIYLLRNYCYKLLFFLINQKRAELRLSGKGSLFENKKEPNKPIDQKIISELDLIIESYIKHIYQMGCFDLMVDGKMFQTSFRDECGNNIPFMLNFDFESMSVTATNNTGV